MCARPPFSPCLSVLIHSVADSSLRWLLWTNSKVVKALIRSHSMATLRKRSWRHWTVLNRLVTIDWRGLIGLATCHCDLHCAVLMRSCAISDTWCSDVFLKLNWVCKVKYSFWFPIRRQCYDLVSPWWLSDTECLHRRFLCRLQNVFSEIFFVGCSKCRVCLVLGSLGFSHGRRGKKIFEERSKKRTSLQRKECDYWWARKYACSVAIDSRVQWRQLTVQVDNTFL